MKKLPLILVVLCLFSSTLVAEQYQTVRRPVIVDDTFTGLSVVREDTPIRNTPLVLPPGTVLDSSYYDWQHNGSLNKRVWVNSDGSVHATYMKSPDQGFIERGMIYYYANNLGNPFASFGDVAAFRNGFGSLSAYPTTSPTGAVAVVSTHDFAAVESYAFVDAFQGIGAFTELATNPADMVVWPKPSVNSDGSLMIVGTLMNNLFVNGIDHNVAWDRAPDVGSGFSQTWTWLGEDSLDYKGSSMEFPSLASGDNGKVGIVVANFGAEVHFWESLDNGQTFAETLITTAATDTFGLPTDPDSTATVFLPYLNSDIAYVGDEPHIVWGAGQGGLSEGAVVLYDFESRILHWSPSTGIDTVVIAAYQSAIPSEVETYVDGGFNHLAIDWPQIGSSPGGDRLYVVYTGMNANDVDPVNLIGFGDIWVVYSEDNGETWSEPINVSNPDGAYPGADDRYPSISPVNYEAAIEPGMDAYIVYQTDDTGGSFLQGEESANQDYFLFIGVDFPEVGIGDQPGDGHSIPKAFALGQNYPNPFNPSTSIAYQLAERSDVTLKIHNVRGQLVRELVRGVRDAGTHTVQWNGKDASGQTVSSGIYLYVLETDKNFRSTRKMVVLK